MNWLVRYASTKQATVWLWPFTAAYGLSLALAGLAGQGPVYHGDIRGYQNPDGQGPDWGMIWDSLTARATFYTSAGGTPGPEAFDHQIRPWPVVVLYELSGGDWGAMLAQIVLYAIAGTLLIGAVARLRLGRPATYSCLALLTLLLASPSVLLFETLTASEGLTVSLVILAIASALRILDCDRPAGWVTVYLGSAGLSAVVRPQLLLIWLPVGAYVAWRRRQAGSPRGRVISITAATLITTAVILWSWAYARAWDGGVSRQAIVAQYVTADWASALAPEVRVAARESLPAPPNCFAILKEPRPEVLGPCQSPSARTEWARQFSRWYLRFVITSPGYTLRFLRAELPQALTLTYSNPGLSLVPLPLQQIVVGANTSAPNTGGEPTKFSGGASHTTFDPLWIAFPALFVGFILSLIRRRVFTLGSRDALGLLVLLSLSGLVTVAAGLLTMPSTVLEINRIGIPGNLALRIGVIVGLAVLGDGIAQSMSPTRAGYREPPPTSSQSM